MRKLITPSGQTALEQALILYAPHHSDELDENPSLKLDVAKQAAPLIDAAVRGFINGILRNFSKKGILKVDFLNILTWLGEAIHAKYPEASQVGLRFGEAFVINEIEGRVRGYFFAMIALNEGRHRSHVKRGKGRMASEETHQMFFRLVENTNALLSIAPNQATAQRILNMASQYKQIKKLWLPFLRGRVGTFKVPELGSREHLTAENDRVAGLLIEEADKEIPMCTSENDTLFKDEPLVMQFAPVDDPRLGMFHNYSTQVDYFKEDIGAVVADSMEVQEALRPKRNAPKGELELASLVSMGDIPPVFLTRFKAELGCFDIGPETLKLLAGKTINYELLRRDIYWYVAQMTCRRHTLQKMYGDIFAPRKKAVKPTLQAVPSDQDPTPNPATDIVRRYPTGEGETISPEARAEAIYGALEEGIAVDLEPEEDDEIIPGDIEEQIDATVERVQRESTVVGHRRLLPLVRRVAVEDGVESIRVSAGKPSQKARRKAAEMGRELRQGIEFIEIGQVVKAQDVPALLERFGVESLEELETRYPGNAFIRYETWVPSHSRGQKTHGVIETIRAEVQRVDDPDV